MAESTDRVLAAIDHAIEDWQVSDDAMRWTPEPPARDPILEVVVHGQSFEAILPDEWCERFIEQYEAMVTQWSAHPYRESAFFTTGCGICGQPATDGRHVDSDVEYGWRYMHGEPVEVLPPQRYDLTDPEFTIRFGPALRSSWAAE